MLLSIRVADISDLSYFECAVIVDADRGVSHVSETVSLLGFSHNTVSIVHRGWRSKQKASLLMTEVEGKWQDWLKLTGRPQVEK